MDRKQQLEDSLTEHGRDKMDTLAEELWKRLLPKAEEISFEKVFVQYDDVSRSFFFVFYIFDVTVAATVYNDIDDCPDEDVYFSAKKAGEVIMTSAAPIDEFFSRLRDVFIEILEIRKKENEDIKL